MATLAELAPAKVNLTLEVLGRRADGFHELASLVAFASAGASDTLSCVPAKPCAVAMAGPFAGSVAGRNLVETAIAMALDYEPGLATGQFVLLKQLPVAAGLGGGSADAGAVLRLLRRLNPAAAVDWKAIARRLGADVPVCFACRAAFMTGTGETLHAVAAIPPLHAVLVNPLVAVPADKTAQVFRMLAAVPLGHNPPQSPPRAFAGADDLIAFMASHGNDLDLAARRVVPAIDAVMTALAATANCRLVRLSGGGPTCFGVYATSNDAGAAAASIAGAHPSWWVAATVLS
ncbi:MAG: 4-(cytidine 5'-diphospho)-2-C-methyl-D-erythritol kinase [Hyphomicrobium sp.]